MYRKNLDKLPLEKIEVEWEKQFIIGEEKIKFILDIYEEARIDKQDIYFRRSKIEELECEQECIECFKNDPKSLENCVIVYLRKKQK